MLTTSFILLCIFLLFDFCRALAARFVFETPALERKPSRALPDLFGRPRLLSGAAVRGEVIFVLGSLLDTPAGEEAHTQGGAHDPTAGLATPGVPCRHGERSGPGHLR